MLSAASGICPVAANRTARWRPGIRPAVQLVSGVTPIPAVACVARMLLPAAMAMWASCSGRSTVGAVSLARVPAGARGARSRHRGPAGGA